jgi:single-strand DNA-binding protein
VAASLNKVQIIGSLGRDPESRSFQNGGKVVNLRVATSESWKDRTTGEKKERTEWHSIAIFNEATGNYAERYLRKGNKVYVEGSLETRKWQDQNGADRYSTEIVIRPYGGQLIGLDPPKANGRGDSHEAANGGLNGRQGFAAGAGDDLDDDCPF